MFSQTSMLQLTWMDPLLNRRLAKFKKDFNKLLYTIKRCKRTFKIKGLKKRKSQEMWVKEMGTGSEGESEF